MWGSLLGHCLCCRDHLSGTHASHYSEWRGKSQSGGGLSIITSKLKVRTKAFPVIVKLRVGSFPALVSSLSWCGRTGRQWGDCNNDACCILSTCISTVQYSTVQYMLQYCQHASQKSVEIQRQDGGVYLQLQCLAPHSLILFTVRRRRYILICC